MKIVEAMTANIAGRINELHAMAQEGAEHSRVHANVAVDAAWECGQLLNGEKAKLKHGAWLAWLEGNCSRLDERTAQRYMACALKYETVGELREARLERIYAAAGVLPDDGRREGVALPRPDEGLLFIQRACQYFNKHDLTKLNEVGRAAWRDRLRPLAELYTKLGGGV